MRNHFLLKSPGILHVVFQTEADRQVETIDRDTGSILLCFKKENLDLFPLQRCMVFCDSYFLN